MSEVRPEWYALTALRGPFVTNTSSRLLEYASNYFELSAFPSGETKRALQHVIDKRAGKPSERIDSGKDNHKANKKKTGHKNGLQRMLVIKRRFASLLCLRPEA